MAERVERPRDAGAGRDVPVVTGPATVAAALATSSTELRVADVAVLRLLALPRDPAPATCELRLVVETWEPPRASWRGRLGPIDGLRTVRLELDPKGCRAEVRVQVAAPVPLADLVAAVMPALRPVGDLSGSGFSRLVVAPDAPDAVLSLLPGPLPRRPAPFYTSLEGLHLRAGDVALQGPQSGEEPVPHPGTQEPIATSALVVDRAGRIVTVPRVADAVVDLQVHNPVGRLPGWEPSPASGSAQVHLDGETLRVLAPDGAPIVEAPVRQPLELRHVRPIRRWGDASLAGLVGLASEDDTERGADVVRRLVELAATGLVLHGLPAGPLPGGEVANPELLAMLGRPYETAIGLERDIRSVAQRRLAMRHHGGFLRLAEAVQASTGQRLLPHVSVVISSRRPTRMAQVLRMLARQTYPHFEVVAIMHGVPAPDLAPYADELAALDLRVVSADASTKFGAALAQCVQESRGDLVTKIDDDDWYSQEHLWDLVLAWLYSGADIVGKTTEYLYFEGIDHTMHRRFATETYHEQVAGGAMLLSRSVLDAIGGWRPTINAADRSVLVGIYDNGGIGYRTHGLGYLYIRHDDGHTRAERDSDLARNTYEQWRHLRLPEMPELRLPVRDPESDPESSNYPRAVNVSGANKNVLDVLRSTTSRSVAEIGIYQGHTSREIARWLNGSGQLHLFDYHDTVNHVVESLELEGYTNVRGFGNSYKYLDSYNWSLGKMLESNAQPIYDFIFIDGAHTWAIDGFATLLADKLLTVGGYLAHDDYSWTLAGSPSLNPRVFPLTGKMYTEEQIRVKQVEMICELLIRRSGRYEEVVPNSVWRKVHD